MRTISERTCCGTEDGIMHLIHGVSPLSCRQQLHLQEVWPPSPPNPRQPQPPRGQIRVRDNNSISWSTVEEGQNATPTPSETPFLARLEGHKSLGSLTAHRLQNLHSTTRLSFAVLAAPRTSSHPLCLPRERGRLSYNGLDSPRGAKHGGSYRHKDITPPRLD
jgi:hypothetical protein